MKLLRRLFTVCCVTMLFLILSCSVCAAQITSITIRYEVSDCNFDFYKVADFSTKDGLALAAPFDKYAETVPQLKTLDSLKAEELRLLASTLDTLVRQDQISPVYRDKTDAAGKLVWEDPDHGLYLVVGQKVRDGDYVYTPSAVLVSIPNRYNGDYWDYETVVRHSKYDRETDDEVNLRVLKLWINHCPRIKLPDSVTVTLLRDGTVYDTVKLSPENDWMYEWKNLPADYVWQATEVEIPDGYSMTVERNGNTFVIRNTYRDDCEEDIWQTGQLWWPVPVLVSLGVTFLVFGWSQRRRRDQWGSDI